MRNAKPLLIGITGGIGSGKSTVCKIFEVLGIKVYDSDTRAKTITVTDTELKKEIIDSFGNESYKEGILNRTFLASRVFNNPEELKKLNNLIHPKVALDFENWVKENADQDYLLKEAALIFEINGQDHLNKVITVYAPEETRIARVLKRDSHRTKDDIKKIIANQFPETKKRELADYLIENGENDSLIEQVLALHSKILAIKK